MYAHGKALLKKNTVIVVVVVVIIIIVVVLTIIIIIITIITIIVIILFFIIISLLHNDTLTLQLNTSQETARTYWTEVNRIDFLIVPINYKKN